MSNVRKTTSTTLDPLRSSSSAKDMPAMETNCREVNLHSSLTSSTKDMPVMEINCGEVNSHSLNQADVHIKGADMSTEYEIKEEIIIKEEIEICEESITTNTIERSLELMPVVYTTKLDDMLIIKKDFEGLTIDDIVENIILESKPKFTQLSDNKNKCNGATDSHKFSQVTEKIRRFNELTSAEVHAEDENESSSITKNISVFSDYIKPESSESEEDYVPLKLFKNSFKDDISKEKEKQYVSKRKKKINTSTDKHNNNHNLSTQQPNNQMIKPNKTCKIILAPTCQAVSFKGKQHTIFDADIKKRSFKYLEGVRYKIGVGRLLIFRYLKRNLSEVMFLMKTGLYTKTYNSIDYDSIMNKSYRKLKYNQSDMSAIYVDICCWFRREHVLDNFLWCARVNPKVCRTEHSCPSPLLCDCCCKNKYIYVVDNKKIIPDPLPQTSAHPTLVLSDNDSLDCEIVPFLEPVSASVDSRSGVQILKDDLSEFYELKSDKIVVKHVEMRSEHSDMRNRTIKLNADSDKVFCCWYKRDAMIESFEFKNVPMITQFIRTPHPCPVDYCTCCCKPNPDTRVTNLCDKVDYLTSSNYSPGLARNYMSIAKRRRQFVTKPKNVDRSIVEPTRKYLSNKAISGTPAPMQTTSEKINQKSNETLKSGKQKDKKVQTSADASPRSLSKKQNKEGISIIRNFVKKNDEPNIKTGKVKQYRNKKNTNSKTSTSTNVTTPSFPMPMQVSTIMQINKTEKEDNANPTSANVTTPGFPMPIQLPNATQAIKTEKHIPPPLGFKQPLLPKQSRPAVPHFPIQSVLGINSILPPPSNTAFPENNMASVTNPITNDSVVNDAYDGTVKTIVNSLLQKFNGVRLIITPEGNVSAEINQPVHTLSTSELQILSKILSHAKEQVNELKAAGALNSATNTVLNPWPNNLNMNTNSSLVTNVNETPIIKTVPGTMNGVPTAPPIIANVDLTATAPTPGPSSSNTSTISSQKTTNKENLHQKYSQIDAFRCYTNLSALKMKEYLTSCRYYLNDVKFTPQIKNVYSLNETVERNSSETQKTLPVAGLTKTYSNTKKGVKRMPEQTPADVPKKLKTVTNKLNTTEASGEKVDHILNSVPDKNQVATLTPIVQPSISPLCTVPVQPIITPMANNNVPGSPMLYGMLNTPQPQLVPTGDIPNQLFIAVPFGLAPGGVLAPIVTNSSYVEQPSTSDVHMPEAGESDDDCILGV